MHRGPRKNPVQFGEDPVYIVNMDLGSAPCSPSALLVSTNTTSSTRLKLKDVRMMSLHPYLINSAIIPLTSFCLSASIDLIAECAMHRIPLSFCTWKIILGAADEALYPNTGRNREPT